MLQCVASLGIVLIVASTIMASLSAVIRFGRPLRGRSSRIPCKPSLSYRFRHNKTVGTEVVSFRARTRLAIPSAAPRALVRDRVEYLNDGPSRHLLIGRRGAGMELAKLKSLIAVTGRGLGTFL